MIRATDNKAMSKSVDRIAGLITLRIKGAVVSLFGKLFNDFLTIFSAKLEGATIRCSNKPFGKVIAR